MKYLSPTVIVLSLVSFFTDVASEMLYPVIPLYLSHIGYGAVYIGLLEGVAEFISGYSKGYFGVLSDKLQKRVIFIRVGYILSSFSKPLMVLFKNWLWVLLMRSSDRLGKGIRTGARDAILAFESKENFKGRVFGFHRAMDTLGATIGPVFALIALHFLNINYEYLFLLAIFPGLISSLLTFKVKENKNYFNNVSLNKATFKLNPINFFLFFKISTKNYKLLTIGLLFFYLFASSNMFLILKLKELNYSDTLILILYIFYNLIYSLLSYPCGILGDKYGLLKVLMVGIFLFGLVYLGLAFTNSLFLIFILFLLYGLYSASTEGISKALISKIEKNNVASAIGTFTSFQSFITLIANVLIGLIWQLFGSKVAFLIIFFCSFISLVYFFFTKKKIELEN